MSSCTNPLLAVRLYKDDLGKSTIKILSRSRPVNLDDLYQKYGQDNLLELPCGHCLACIQNKKKEWAVRCLLEASDHKENCFVTLTYDSKNYDDKFHKEHLRKFFKRLYSKGFKFRYYGCGERGDEEGRCHYHLIMFGFFPSDAKYYSKTKSGSSQFTSQILSEAWELGFVTVSEFEAAEASYVAGYAYKKIGLQNDSFHFQSTKPGIGQGYVLRNIQDIYDQDKLVVNFGSHSVAVPRYFDKIAIERFNMDLDDLKKKRLDRASIQCSKSMRELGFEYRPEFLDYKNEVNTKNIKLKRRMF